MAALTALIPSCNDAYTLSFCLESIAPHFDEIIVLDDASIDKTESVLQNARTRWPHIQAEIHTGTPLGPVDARNRLLDLARGDHLFFLDADDVLIERNAPLLHEVTAAAPLVGLQLAEMWGDFEHTTQRLEHYDPCHIYLNRTIVRDIVWGGHGGSIQRPAFKVDEDYRGATAMRGPGPLFWHLHGVKPDWRLLGRLEVRQWLANGRPSNYYDAILARDPALNHRLALERLLRRDDCRLRRYAGSPPRPAVLEAAAPRFEVVYRNGRPVDRIDHGWWAGGASQPRVSPHFVSAHRPLPPSRFTLRRIDAETVELGSAEARLRMDNLAYAIWSLCDGQSTIREISDRFASAYPDQAEETVRDAVLEAVLTLYRQKVLRLPGLA